MWLGDLDQNSLAVMLGADFTISGDWLFLALSAMGKQTPLHPRMTGERPRNRRQFSP